MIEEKQRLVELLNEYIDGPGLTVVIGAEHLDPNLRPFSLVASTYDDGVGHRDGRRHRSDAHALLARDRRRRRRGAGGVARAARSQLGTSLWLTKTRSNPADRRRRRPTRPTRPTPSGRSDDAQARARRLQRSPAAQDRRVRQLPQARRARAPRAGRPGGRRSAAGAAAGRRRLRSRADGGRRRRAPAPTARASS